MERLKSLASRVIREENGGEVLEYALILGLIIVGTITAIGVVGTRVLARWNTISNSSL
jgi:Flp pilus assembly pilin Flp